MYNPTLYPLTMSLQSVSMLQSYTIKNLRLNGHTSFEFQTRNYNTCFGHIYYYMCTKVFNLFVIRTTVMTKISK